MCVCNHGAYTDNSADAVDRLLIDNDKCLKSCFSMAVAYMNIIWESMYVVIWVQYPWIVMVHSTSICYNGIPQVEWFPVKCSDFQHVPSSKLKADYTLTDKYMYLEQVIPMFYSKPERNCIFFFAILIWHDKRMVVRTRGKDTPYHIAIPHRIISQITIHPGLAENPAPVGSQDVMSQLRDYPSRQ